MTRHSQTDWCYQKRLRLQSGDEGFGNKRDNTAVKRKKRAGKSFFISATT